MNDQVQSPAPNSSKAGMWVAIVIVVLVLAVGAYFVLNQDNGTNTNNTNVAVNTTINKNTNTSDSVDTSGWEQYTNSMYRYSFRHPSSLQVEDYTVINSQTYGGNILSNVLTPARGGTPLIQVDVVDDTMESVQKYITSLANTNQLLWSPSAIGGSEGEMASLSSDNKDYINYHIVVYDGLVYVITTSATGPTDYVANTFTFIE